MERRVPQPEEVLAQTRWVARLALALTGDRHRGEDLTQDTLLAALERPPLVAGVSDLRAWLGRVLRNRVFADHARRPRPRGPDQAAAPSPDEVLGREEVRAALVRRVLALPEEARTVLLLRYFEELPAAEVARRLGLPASTVRSRVRRALETLRHRLQAESADWRADLRALVPVGTLKEGGVVLMGKTKLAVGTILVVGAGTWWSLSGDVGWNATSSEVNTADPVEQEAGGRLARGGPGPEREEPADEHRRAVLAALPADFAQLVHGTVRSVDGRPVIDGSVTLVDRLGERHTCSLDRRATYSIHGLDPGVYTLQAWSQGYLPLEDEQVEVPADGVPYRRDVVLSPSWSVKVRVLDADGELMLRAAEEGARHQLTAAATLDPPGEELPPTTGRFHGLGRFRSRFLRREDDVPDDATGVLEVLHDGPVHVSLALRSVVVASRLVHPGTEAVEFQVGQNPVGDRLATVNLRLVSAGTGRPLEGARTSLNTSSSGGGGRTSGADGRVTLEEVPPGWLELRVWGEGLGPFRELVEVQPGSVQDLGEVRVPAAVELDLRVVDEKGAPIPGLFLDMTAPDRVDCAAAFRMRYGVNTDSEGRLALRVAEGRTLLVPGSGEWAANGILVDTSDDVEQRDVVLPRGRRLALVFPRGTAVGSQEEYLVRTFGGLPVAAGELRRDPVPLRLTPGRYRVEIWRGPDRISTHAFEVDDDTERIEVGS